MITLILATTETLTAGEAIMALMLLGGFSVVYFFPSVVAAVGRHHNTVAIGMTFY